jgi:hypothetical protein
MLVKFNSAISSADGWAHKFGDVVEYEDNDVQSLIDAGICSPLEETFPMETATAVIPEVSQPEYRKKKDRR